MELEEGNLQIIPKRERHFKSSRAVEVKDPLKKNNAEEAVFE